MFISAFSKRNYAMILLLSYILILLLPITASVLIYRSSVQIITEQAACLGASALREVSSELDSFMKTEPSFASDSNAQLQEKLQQIHPELLIEYVVLDDNGQPLLASKNFSALSPEAIQSIAMQSEYMINDQPYQLQQRPLDDGRQLLAAVSVTNATEQLALLRNKTLLFIAIALFLGLILIIAFMYRHYKPVTSVLKMVSSLNGESRQTNNEFDEIHAAVKTLLQNQKNSKNALEQATQTLKSVSLANHLLGQKAYLNEDLSSCFPFSLEDNAFRVVLIQPEEIKHLFESYAITEAERMEDAKFIIKNIFDELLAPSKATELIPMDTMNMVSVIQDPENLDEFIAKLQYGASFIRTQFHLKLHITISDSVESIDKISQCYYQSLSLRKDSLTANSVMTSKDLRPVPENKVGGYPAKLDLQLLSALRQKEFDKCIATIEEILATNPYPQLSNENIHRYLQNCIANTILRYLAETDSDTLSPNLWGTINDLFEDKFDTNSKDLLYYLCSELCQVPLTNTTDDIETKIKNIIAREYRNKELSVTYIAERLGLHNVYLSSMYKEKTGIRLLETIHRFRTEKAKKILEKEPSCSIDALSDRVGYANTKTFSRIFKKYEGISPSEYREICQK